MVTQNPLDCLHLVELGVMRTFLHRVLEKCTKIEKETF